MARLAFRCLSTATRGRCTRRGFPSRLSPYTWPSQSFSFGGKCLLFAEESQLVRRAGIGRYYDLENRTDCRESVMNGSGVAENGCASSEHLELLVQRR